MKSRCDSSTADNSELGKRAGEEFADFFAPVSKADEAPGHDCLYLYSANYLPVDKLVNKFGSSLGVTESEFDEERKIIWLGIKSSYNKVDSTVPFSGQFRQSDRKGAQSVGKRPTQPTAQNKKYKMRLRDKPLPDFDRHFHN